jgi:GDPmannose 4,6-dehydratase
MKNIIITGVTGQDGAYLSQYLLSKSNNYKIYGIFRRTSLDPLQRLKILGIHRNINLLDVDLAEHNRINYYIKTIKPVMFFNLAAMSFVGYSYDNPVYTDQVNNLAVLNILESIKLNSQKTKFYQASSSEMYGDVIKKNIKLNEDSKFNPISPYAISKLSAYYYTRMYRKSYKIFASNGILFNHEGPLRGDQFVTKKIIKGLLLYKKTGIPLSLGNIYSRRDWGNAEDYVKMMYKILCYSKPDDFVIASEQQYSVKDFVNLVCKSLKINIKWLGKGLNEKAVNEKGKPVILVSKKFFRPLDVVNLLGDASKANKILGWESKISIHKLIKNMIDHELNNSINLD